MSISGWTEPSCHACPAAEASAYRLTLLRVRTCVCRTHLRQAHSLMNKSSVSSQVMTYM